jgi:cytidylate kinase
MTAKTVTFTVQVGSGGFAIARAVAEQLGYRYYDWEVTSQAAQLAGVSAEVVAASERMPGFIERVMRRLSTVQALSSEDPVLEPPPAMVLSAIESLTSDDYRQFIERVVRELANAGDSVIVGHAAQAVLKDDPGVFRVLVAGTLPRRADRLALEQQTTVEQAASTVKQSDKDREDFFRRVYHMDWTDATSYDLCICTDNVSTAVATEAVTAAAKQVAGTGAEG